MPANDLTEWSQTEIDLLTALRADGKSAPQIHGVLPTRTLKAIENKLRHLRLTNHYKPKPPKRVRSHMAHNDIPRAGKTTLPPLPSLQGDTQL